MERACKKEKERKPAKERKRKIIALVSIIHHVSQGSFEKIR